MVEEHQNTEIPEPSIYQGGEFSELQSKEIISVLEGAAVVNEGNGIGEKLQFDSNHPLSKESDKRKILDIIKKLDGFDYIAGDGSNKNIPIVFEKGTSYTDIKNAFTEFDNTRTKSEDGTFYGGGGSFTKNHCNAVINGHRVYLEERLTTKGVQVKMYIYYNTKMFHV